MALNTVSSDRLATNVKNTNFTSAEKQDLTDDIKPLLGSSGGGSKNKIINGAMLVAQRGTSSTTSGYGTVDRFKVQYSGTDEAPTQAQVDVVAGTTPYTLGFRKALKITNGNQTGGAGASDFVRLSTFLEGQDIANSGWNYKSASSFITLSFWVKSSVAQNFYGFIRNTDGTMYQYPFETGSLTADTWTKITKTIPGNSNLTFDNDNGGAFELYIHQFSGTDETASSVTLNAWATYSGSAKMPDFTSTWYTTNDATFELTGMQLEVGSVATDFDHKTFGQELQLCNRYYYDVLGPSPETDFAFAVGMKYNGTYNFAVINFPVQMRTVPTLESSTTTNAFYKLIGSTVDDYATNAMLKGGRTGARIYPNTGNDDHGSSGDTVLLHANNTSACQLRFNAEL